MNKFCILRLHQFDRLEEFQQLLQGNRDIQYPQRDCEEDELHCRIEDVPGFPLTDLKTLEFDDEVVNYLYFIGHIETQKRVAPYDGNGRLKPRDERVDHFAPGVLVFENRNRVFAIVFCGATNGKRVMKKLFPSEVFGLIEPCEDGLTEDLLYWLFKHYIDVPDDPLSEGHEIFVIALESYRGTTRDNANAVTGEGSRISTILGTLAFLFNNEKLKSLRPQIQYMDEAVSVELRLTGTFALWPNTYNGEYFRGLTGIEKQNALAIYVFLQMLPSIVECYNTSTENQEWSPQLKIDFVRRLGSMIRQRVDAELVRIEEESRGTVDIPPVGNEEESGGIVDIPPVENDEDEGIDEFDE
ncbi:hypothetical protein [Bacillus mycoides]|uniref:hypothetical protein n=1 Tax=Bacillus mycoides TaxID=1405 RepID=UPI00119EA770|nr:hypothetical protein [Bacillus mycoides]